MYSQEERKKGGVSFAGKKERDDTTIGPGPGAYEQTITSVKT